MSTQQKLYAFVDKATLEFLRTKAGKVAWASASAAKNAFNLHMQQEDFAVKLREQAQKSHWHTVDQLWAKQDKYSLVEIYFDEQIIIKEI